MLSMTSFKATKSTIASTVSKGVITITSSPAYFVCPYGDDTKSIAFGGKQPPTVYVVRSVSIIPHFVLFCQFLRFATGEFFLSI